MPNKETMLCTVPCPYCHKELAIIKQTETITPATPAEKKETFHAEKSTWSLLY